MNEELIARIGKVPLFRIDGAHPEDVYSDGDPVEREMLLLAQRRTPPEELELIRSWPVYYHFSPLRGNLIEALPIEPRECVLELGSGCGAVTGALARRAARVDGVDLSLRRTQINAWRHNKASNLRLFVGNAMAFSPDDLYDWVTLIGVFEYASAFIRQADPFAAFLRLVAERLRPGGRLALAIENQFGLKYWAGAREDHSGRLFDGLEGYAPGSPARTFSRPHLLRLLEQAGFEAVQVYYPYPDYKFCSRIFSDARLPQPGELTQNLVNRDQDRLYLFQESRVWDELCQAGQFPFFANAFLMIAKRGERLPHHA